MVGSMNTDLVTRATVIPSAGETVFGSSFKVFFGGKGANQAFALKQLGARTTFVGAVGDDSFGVDYKAYFEKNQINTSGISIVPGVSTGCAPIWVDETDGENRIIVVPGANDRVSPTRVSGVLCSAALSGSRFAVVCQNEINLDATIAALEAGRSADALTVLTPAPVPSSPFPPTLYPTVSLLIPNAQEASALAGLEVESAGMDKAAAARAACTVLLARGVGAVVVTLGSQGCLVCSAAGGGPQGGAVHVPGVKVGKVVDTTGAGDCFSGSLTYFILLLLQARGGPATPLPLDVLVEAAGRATYVAACSVLAQGTQASYRSREELPDVLFDPPTQDACARAVAACPLC